MRRSYKRVFHKPCAVGVLSALVALAIGRQTLRAESFDAPVKVEITVAEEGTTRRVPCRIHLYDAAGKPVKPMGFPFWNDHFVCDGTARLKLPAGEYRYEIERGPEYTSTRKAITVKPDSELALSESLRRIVDLAREGWWSGETHIHRQETDVQLLMRAEDLHIGVAITWWNDRNVWKERALPERAIERFDTDRFVDMMGGEDERGGGALLFTHLREPLPIAGSKRESPASAKWLHEAKSAGAWVDAEKPFWWDFPLWLVSGKLDSIGLANNHMNRSRMLDNEAWGRPRDRELLTGPHGNGLWTQELYYHALNCGFRIPPSAGSASGVLPNPVGYNRVYAFIEGALTWDKWWESVQAGRVFVTNGPLLRLKAEEQLPGHAFQSAGPIEITLDGKLDAQDPIARIELVQNGRVETIRLPAKVRIDRSGWFLVRAIADVPHTFRFASTGPWYVEIGDKKASVSRASCELFLRWTEERIEHLQKAPMSEEERRAVLTFHEAARRQWMALRKTANAE